MKFDCTVNKNIYHLFPDWEAVWNRNKVKYEIRADNLAATLSFEVVVKSSKLCFNRSVKWAYDLYEFSLHSRFGYLAIINLFSDPLSQ